MACHVRAGTREARSAIDWCMQHDVPLAIALAGGAANLFVLLGLLHEFRRRSEALEPHLSSELPPQLGTLFG